MIRVCAHCQAIPELPERAQPWAIPGFMPSEGAGCPTCGLNYCEPCAKARDQQCKCGTTLVFGRRYDADNIARAAANERILRNLVVASDPED